MTELFRRQAVDFQRQKFHGAIVLTRSPWQAAVTVFFVALVLALVAFAATRGFARKESVGGVLLPPGGVLRLATDWEEYAQQMLEVMRGNPQFTNLSPTGDWMPRPEERAPTRFEKRGARLGHGVWDLAFRRG